MTREEKERQVCGLMQLYHASSAEWKFYKMFLEGLRWTEAEDAPSYTQLKDMIATTRGF